MEPSTCPRATLQPALGRGIVQVLGGQRVYKGFNVGRLGLHGVDDLPGLHWFLSNSQLDEAERDDGDLAVGTGAVGSEA